MSKLFFSHDLDTRLDPKIMKLIMVLGFKGYGLWWAIIETAHREDIEVGKEDVLAFSFREDIETIKSILNDYDLFYVENNFYKNNRVIANLQLQKEKSEKAKKNINARWGKKHQTPPAENKPLEIDMEFVNSVIQEFNIQFKKSFAVKDETKEDIYNTSKKYDLTLETWKTIIENAQCGWDFDGETKQPTMQKVVEQWDRFLNNDYNLKPNKAKAARKKAEAERLEREEKEKERQEAEKAREEREARKKSLKNKDDAIAFYLETNMRMPAYMISKSSLFNELSEKFNFTLEDVLTAKGEQNA